MPRVSELRTNFTAGELSKTVNARTNFGRYFNGSEALENWVILTQGPIFRRKGLRFLAETKDSTKKSRLIPFEFSTVQTYAIEMGDGYMRFFSAQGVVLDNMSNVLEISTPYSESELFDIKFVQDSDVIYLAHPNHPIQKLIRLAFNDFTLDPVGLIKGPYIEQNIVSVDTVTISGGGPWTEGSTLTLTANGGFTPFTADHIGGLWKVTEGTDIAHLEITGFTSSTIVTVEAKNDIPVSLQNVAKFTWSEGEFSDARSYPSAITFHEQRLVLAGSINAPQKIWFSTSGDFENFEVGTNDDNAFNIKIAAQKGDPIRWLFSDELLFVGTASGIFRVTTSRNGSSLSVSDIDVKRQISFGCSQVQPELVGDLPVYMQKGSSKARGISFSIDRDKYGASDLTIDSDQIIESGITEIDYQQDPISSLWAVRNDGQIAKLTFESDQEIQAWSRYVTEGSFESVAVINDANDNDEIYFIVNRTIGGVTKRFVEVHEPNYLVDNINRFFVDSGLTYNGTGSAQLTLSSSTGSSVLVTEVEEDALVTEDELVYVTEEVDVTITANMSIFSVGDIGKEIHQLPEFGNGKALITGFVSNQIVIVEIIEPFTGDVLNANTWAFAVKLITGLDHLIGETVSINSDGATVTNTVVDESGEIEIDVAGSIVHVGLPYISRQRNMPIEASALASVIGSSQHKLKRIDTIVARFSDTNGGQIVVDGGNIPISARGTNNNMNETPPLFEGDIEVTIGSDWDNLGQIDIIQPGPQPMMLKSITYKVTVNDK